MKSPLCTPGFCTRTVRRLYPTSCAFTVLVLLTSITSCIYDAPGDEFYRTLWTGTDNTLGKVTVEFLCGGHICIKSQDAAGSYGVYESDGLAASFEGVSLRYGSATSLERATTGPSLVIIEEAHRNGDTITLFWHLEGSSEVHTLVLERLSAYE